MKMNITKARIIAQLRENTGAHMLDSGGAYGRGWERWGKVTDEAATAKPAAYVTDDFIQINTVEWLANRAEYDEKMTRVFRLWAKIADPEDRTPWLVQMEEFAERAHDGYEEGQIVVNTYNHDSMLDETLQFATFEYRGEKYALIQTHNGCDVRGGYSSPVAYRLGDEGAYELLDEGVEVWHATEEDGHGFELRAGESFWDNRDGYSVEGDDAPKVENGVVTCPCGETMELYMREVY